MTREEPSTWVLEVFAGADGSKPNPNAPAPAFILSRSTNRAAKALLKGPIFMWRLGLGPLVGRAVMILTTTGRKSGLPRRTAVGFHQHHNRKYVVTLRGPNTDWYRNMLADPHVTVQTAGGSEHMVARRVTEDEELAEAYDFLARMPVMKRWAEVLRVRLSPEELVAHKDDFILLTFEPTTEPTPSPLQPDLWWLWPMLEFVALLLARRARKHTMIAA